MRIGIVSDVPSALEAMRRAVALEPAHRILWTADEATRAVELCALEPPDLVLIDPLLRGPGGGPGSRSDGVEATRCIMAASPCAILIVTASVGDHTARVYEAMGHGALDAVDTPRLDTSDPLAAARPLLAKIETIGKLIRDRIGGSLPVQPRAAADTHAIPLIAIGASTGGPAALVELLSGLPRDLAAAVVIVQHVDAQFAPGMVDWLASNSTLPVRLVREGEMPAAGTVLLAGTNDHLYLRQDRRLGYTPEPRDVVYRPSVDVFFRSLCERWNGDTIGVLLTGMGRDGAAGLKALRDKGCYTIAQNRASCAVFGMPKAAIALGAAVDVLPLADIARELHARVQRRKTGGKDPGQSRSVVIRET